MKSTDGNRPEQQDEKFGKGGVSGQPVGPHEGPVAGGADNTRGENVPSREGSGGGAKKGKSRGEGTDYPQGSKANPATTSRGADSSDKEFRNNQPNASTLKGSKSNENLGLDKE